MKKTIFIFNDGTGQYLGSDAPTNVAKLFNCFPGEDENMLPADAAKKDSKSGNVAIYVRGIGTVDTRYVKDEPERNLWEKIVAWVVEKKSDTSEQIFGDTIVDRIQRSYETFQKVYNDGDEVVLVGFSRGAASVRLLASELIKRHNVKIKYMLVFDTVYSVTGSIKVLDGEPMSRFTDLDINPGVEKCDHLIAGDEMREKFPFSPVNKRDGVRQILFSGSHSDVGGGHKTTGLSDISLKFAIEQLKALGFVLDQSKIDALKINPRPDSATTYVIVGGTGQRHFPRALQDTDFLVHQSVIERSKVRGAVSIALSQLSVFHAETPSELVSPKHINSSFDL